METNPPSRRRSVLYMPASNAKAIAKARSLPCDVVVLDLEDAVAPEAKGTAREGAVSALREGGFGTRELVVRVNGPDTPYWAEDIAALRDLPVPVLLPKVGDPAMLASAAQALPDRPLWAMIETCEAILNIAAIADAAQQLPLAALVVGTNDLAKEMHCRLEASRRPVWSALTATVMAARANGIAAFDGVFNDIADEAGFEAECREAADFGFDGKTLIHPRQIEPCNRAFSPSAEELAWARLVIETFGRAENSGSNALKIEGRMVERLHVAAAERAVARADPS